MVEKEVIFDELNQVRPLVDVAVVLEDLAMLDSDTEWWPRDIRRRALIESIEKRKFFSTSEECIETVDLWMKLKDQFPLKQMHHARIFISEFLLYREGAKVKENCPLSGSEK
jgi:hypothetical protein